jgi:hexosaminidase
VAAIVLFGSVVAGAGEPSLIPWPARVSPAPGGFTVNRQTSICATGDTIKVAQRLQSTLREVQELDLHRLRCGPASITLTLAAGDPEADPERYTLDVDSKGMRIVAQTEAGLYYGAMTAAQLLSTNAAHNSSVHLSGIHIEDAPRFKWRGLMLDPVRHFLSVASVETIIEQMGQHKLNVLQLHLTDDQGWRVEIKRYPQLTKVGAWRSPPSNGGAGSETGTYGGFYTQQDIREIVAYASARYITVVPEIDLPGHAQAAIAAYPELGVTGERPGVSSNWGVNSYLYDTSPASLTFVENVLDEILPLFPGKYIHLGGDEAIKDQWKSSPAIRARMQALGIADEEAMQSWFMSQIGSYLAARGRTMVGWDEILDGGVPANAVVMSWRGTNGAVEAARLGHDVVLSPSPTLYLDNLQSRQDDEPAGRPSVVSLSQVYNFDAVPAALSTEAASYVSGAQAGLWSEYLLSDWHLQHAAFPRVDALSEAVWTAPALMNWAGFLDRLPAQMRRYRRQSIAAADSAFAVDFEVVGGGNAAVQNGEGLVKLANQAGFGTIRYTIDGSEPDSGARSYTSPLPLHLGTEIKAAVFSSDGLPLAATRSFAFRADTLSARSSSQLQVCPGNNLRLRLPLTPDSPAVAPVYDVDLLNSCYVYPRALLSGATALELNIARLARNFGLANHKNQLKSYPARTRFGELVVYQDRCESGAEMARVALPDPAGSEARQAVEAVIAPTTGEHDLCFVFTAPTSGPLYAIDTVRLMRPRRSGRPDH